MSLGKKAIVRQCVVVMVGSLVNEMVGVMNGFLWAKKMPTTISGGRHWVGKIGGFSEQQSLGRFLTAQVVMAWATYRTNTEPSSHITWKPEGEAAG
jgi:hypothetical protein